MIATSWLWKRVIDEDFAVSGLQDVAGSGSLGSSFEIEAGILQNQAYLKVDDPQVESLLIGKANDMIVALDLAIQSTQTSLTETCVLQLVV